jgi:hypothetical protein
VLSGRRKARRGRLTVKERCPPHSQRLPWRCPDSAGDAPRRAASAERVATNGEGLAESDERRAGRSPSLARRDESRAETSQSGSGNGEGGSRNDERLARNGRGLPANGRSRSGQTRGTPRSVSRLTCESERVGPCHAGSAESAVRVAANAQRLPVKDESVAPRVAARRVHSLVRPPWNLRVKIRSERRSTNARGVPRNLRTGRRTNLAPPEERLERLGASLGPSILLPGGAPRSLGGSTRSPRGSTHSPGVSPSGRIARKPCEVCRGSPRVVPRVPSVGGLDTRPLVTIGGRGHRAHARQQRSRSERSSTPSSRLRAWPTTPRPVASLPYCTSGTVSLASRPLPPRAMPSMRPFAASVGVQS